MAELYKVGNPINRHERNNLNLTFTDILRRFAHLQKQISDLSGSEEVQDLLNQIADATQQALDAEQAALSAEQSAINAANDAIDAKEITEQATTNANTQADYAKEKADYIAEREDTINYFISMQTSLQEQINQLVVNGDSSVEAAQARVSTDDLGNVTNFVTLKQRLDEEHNQVTTQLAQVAKIIYPALTTQEQIQDALNGGGHFKFVGGLHQYDLLFTDVDGYKCAFILSDNTTIEFAQDTKLELKPHNLNSYKIFAVTNKQNVKFINVTLDGKRDLNSAVDGEWGFGIALKGATDVALLNVTSNNCWGDGLYIGSTSSKPYCKDVIIENLVCDNNRRQGISLISAVNLTINRVKLTNTIGSPPQAGLDIEPNQDYEKIIGVKIKDIYTSGNKGAGIEINLQKMNENTERIDITIENHIDNGSAYGVNIPAAAIGASGEIMIINPLWKNNVGPSYHSRGYYNNSPKVILIKPTIIDSNTTTNTDRESRASISIYRSQNDINSGEIIGNIDIIEPKIIRTKDANNLNAIYIRNYANGVIQRDLVKNISIINPIKLDAVEPGKLLINGDVKIEDKYNLLEVKSNQSNVDTSSATCPMSVDNVNDQGLSFVTLAPLTRIGKEITIKVRSIKFFEIRMSPDTSVHPISTVPGRTIRTNKIGSKIKLIKVSATDWVADEILGVWEEVGE